MKKGTVKFFNEEKGYGFITNNDNKKDVFVHVTSLEVGIEIAENDQVEYEEQEGKKGLSAVSVKLAD